MSKHRYFFPLLLSLLVSACPDEDESSSESDNNEQRNLESLVIPQPPESIISTQIKFNSVQFSWSASNDATYYQIKRDGNILTSNNTQYTKNNFIDTSVSGATSYRYEVEACNELGCSSSLNFTVFTPSNQTNIRIDAISASSVSLSWQAISDMSYYSIAKEDNGSSSQVVNVRELKYTVTGLASDTNYTFQIKGCDESACTPVQSIGASTASYQDIIPPSVQELKATPRATEINLSWAATESAEFYRIYRDQIILGNGQTPQSTYTDVNLPVSTSFIYDVEACNDNGCSEKTSINAETLAVVEPMQIPKAPIPPTVKVSGSNKIIISWPIVAHAQSYKLYRDGAEIADTITANSFDDGNVSSNTAYQYQVQACNKIGCSVKSASSHITSYEGDKLSIRIVGFDNPGGESIPLTVYTENADGTIFVDNYRLDKNGMHEYNRTIMSNGRYGVSLQNKASNGQVCRSDKPNFNRQTGGQNVIVTIDCETSGDLSFAHENIQRILQKNETFAAQQPTLTTSSGERISASAVLYSSTNSAVASVDENTGEITAHGAGITQIQVTAKSGYYIAKPASYYLYLIEPSLSIKLQRVEVGNSILLQVNSRFQNLANKAKTIIRVFIYTESSPLTFHPLVKLKITYGDKTLEKLMQCPTNLRNSAYPSSSYNKNDACFVIITASEAETFIQQDTKFTIIIDGKLSHTVLPKVSKNSTINIKVVPIKVNGQTYTIPSVEDITRATKRVYPFYQVNVSVRDDYAYQGGYTGDLPVNTQRWSPFLGGIENLRRLESDGKTHYYGMMPSKCYGVVGLAYLGGMSGIGVSSYCGNSALYSTFIHELGHNLSLRHAPCKTTSSDSFWSSADAWQGASAGKLSPQALFNIHTDKVFAPGADSGDDSDVMGYCRGQWLSEYSVNKVISHISNRSAYQNTKKSLIRRASKEGNAEYNTLLISGNIIDDKVRLEPVVPSDNSNYELEHGDYHLVLITKDGQQIKHSFTPLKIDHYPNQLYFSKLIPTVSHIQKISIYYKDKLLITELPTRSLQANQNRHQVFAEAVPIKIVRNANNIDIYWDHIKYPWMTLIYKKLNKDKQVVIINTENGHFQTQYFSDKLEGEIIISISDGLNSLQLIKKL